MKEDFRFKKKFGQNFLTDKNLLRSIVSDADINENDVVLEIGAGAGALTQELVNSAKRVVSFEIDNELKEILEEKFKLNDNLNIIFDDFLNYDDKQIFDLVGDNFKVVANLPYYITTPILTKLLSLSKRPAVIVVMVQKEVGERFVATSQKGDYGYFSVFLQANADVKITRIVNRKMFNPMPNVDSCIVRLNVKNSGYCEKFYEFLKSVFVMKRKTIVNNLQKAYNLDKQIIIDAFEKNNINVSLRADSLGLEELYNIYKIMDNSNFLNKK